jgi:endonuclease/exonuclease/phosphatase family metal-dependent hydrolase
MVIGSTIFLRFPDDTTNYQIDHILIDAGHENNMMDVRTYMGANADSDHYLVITRIRANISMSKYVPNKDKQYDTI